jgi:D-alanyl-D-alanine carboxypeptidase
VVACGDPLAPLDKQRRLSSDCVPSGLVYLPDAYVYGEGQLLVSSAADAVVRLIDAAAADGINIYVTSSYRNYDHQVSTYTWHVNTYGQAHADRVSARPGHSEHQLGTTADVVSASANYDLEQFPGTPEAAWVEANAVRFGFVISYPEGMEATTGYAYEPWHIRYVGESVAADVDRSGLTLGEYLRSR